MLTAEKKILTDVGSAQFEADIPPQAMGVVVVDTDAIAHNYRYMGSLLKEGAKVGAVVKGNAYGVGMAPVARKLFLTGCRDFFVVNLDEAMKLREALPDPETRIYVFNGVTAGTEDLFHTHHLIPILIEVDQVQRWVRQAQRRSQRLPAILHVDTGMARKGLDFRDCEAVLPAFEALEIHYVMTHYTSSNLPQSPENERQRTLFQKFLEKFPPCATSMANSCGIALGHDFQGDLVRSGLGLYGLASPFPEAQVAVKIFLRVVQTRHLEAGRTVGYTGSYRCQRDSRLATLGMGYADGILRALANKGHVSFYGHKARILGNISMDSIVVDVTEVPEHLVQTGGWAALYVDREDFIQTAKQAETVVYQLIIGLGDRYHRVYR